VVLDVHLVQRAAKAARPWCSTSCYVVLDVHLVQRAAPGREGDARVVLSSRPGRSNAGARVGGKAASSADDVWRGSKKWTPTRRDRSDEGDELVAWWRCAFAEDNEVEYVISPERRCNALYLML
jgi:hypothetical protein